MPFGWLVLTDRANKLTDNLIKVVHRIGEHESTDIGNSTGEVAGIIVLPAGGAPGLNNYDIVIDNGSGDVEEKETAVHFLEDRKLGSTMRSSETARILDEGI